jgi:enoyl-CoA hydratase
MDLVRIERREAVAILTLDRPDALNALSSAMLEAICDAAATLAADSALGAVVVTGAGRAFAAGADIEEMNAFSAAQAESFSRLGHAACAAFESLTVPVIAAVNGFALGGGCELACACDWIYAAENALFGQPEVNLGAVPGFGGTSRLPRRVGPGWARELVLGGAPIDAETALRIGLVNRIFPVDGLLNAAVASGALVATKGPLAVAAAKALLLEGQDADVRVAHALEQRTFGLTFASEDRAEGMRAFLDKRPPEFKGR